MGGGGECGGHHWPACSPPPLSSTGEWGLLHTLHCKLKHTTRLYIYHTSTTLSFCTSTRTKQHTLYLSHILNKQHMQTATHTQTRTNFFNKWSTNPIPAHTTNTGSSTPNVCTHTPPPPPQHWQLPPPLPLLERTSLPHCKLAQIKIDQNIQIHRHISMKILIDAEYVLTNNVLFCLICRHNRHGTKRPYTMNPHLN